MTSLQRIQESVAALLSEDMKVFAEWFEGLQADLWDEQIKTDAEAGRFDAMAEAALAAHKAGRTRPL